MGNCDNVPVCFVVVVMVEPLTTMTTMKLYLLMCPLKYSPRHNVDPASLTTSTINGSGVYIITNTIHVFISLVVGSLIRVIDVIWNEVR